MESLTLMRCSLKNGNIGNFVRLHNVLLALQHWGDDIIPSNGGTWIDENTPTKHESPLLSIENSEHLFTPMATTLRASLGHLLWSLELLNERLGASSQT
jgi:hypothetical protein